MRNREVEQILKTGPSSDWSLQLDSMKSESLVIAGQLYRGEYVLKSCTRVAMRSSTQVGALILIQKISVRKSNQDNIQCLEAKSQSTVREDYR